MNNTPVQIYGHEQVIQPVLRRLSAPNALQKREVEDEKPAEGGTVPPLEQEETGAKKGQMWGFWAADTNQLPPL